MAVNPTDRGFRSAQWTAELNIDDFVAKWGTALLATARRNCQSAADADDAYQRALEILLTKPPRGLDEELTVAWMHTVVRNEALQLVRKQNKIVDADFESMAESMTADVSLPESGFEESESLAHVREGLSKIRPDQARCLLLKADGLSNPEICEHTGFSYAKVNRLLSEGRQALVTRVTSIEGGRECQSIEPTLLLMSEGEVEPALLRAAESHLEHCLACRSTLRELRAAPSSLAALLPVGAALVPAKDAPWTRVADHVQGWLAQLQEKLFGQAAAGQQTAEIAVAKKAAVAVMAVGTVVAGGVAVERSTDGPPVEAPGSKTAPVTQSQIRPSGLTAKQKSDVAARRRAESRAARPVRQDELIDPRTANGAALEAEPEQQNEVPEAALDAAPDAEADVPPGANERTGSGGGGLAP